MKIKLLNGLILGLLAVFLVNILVPIYFANEAVNNPSANPGSDTTEELPTGGVVVDNPSLTVEDMVANAVESINGNSSYKCINTGSVVANTSFGKTTQNIYAKIQRDTAGKVYIFNASVKSGAIGVTVGQEIYYDNNRLYYRETDNVTSSFIPDFSKSCWKNFSKTSFFENKGYKIANLYFIVDNSTILSYNNYVVKSTYSSCEIILDPKLSTINYIKYLQNSSGSTTTPDIKSVKIKLIVGSDGKPIKITTEEKYNITVPLAGTVSCEVINNYNYSSFDSYFTITKPQGF